MGSPLPAPWQALVWSSSAPFLADSRGKKTFLTQPLVILDGMAGVPVVCRRASSKIRRRRAAFTSQPLLLGGQLEMRVVGLRWQPGQIAALGFASAVRCGGKPSPRS